MARGKIIIAITGIIYWGVLLGCASTSHNDTIIHNDTRYGNVDKVASLLAEWPELINAKGKEEETPLHIAAKEGNQEIAELLIAKGADVNTRDINGKTPLHDAAFWCHENAGIASIGPWEVGEQKEIAKLLIAKGADINARDINGKTPLHDAAFWCYAYTTEEMVVGNMGPVYAMLDRCADKDSKIDFMLYSYDNQVSITSTDLWTYKGCGEIAELLIAKGADINARDINGKTPLHDAAFWGNIEVTELIIGNGIDVNDKDKRGCTPLDLAAKGRSKDVAKLLIANGADVGCNSLSEAINSGLKEIVELLISKGADVNAGDINGRAHLHDAASIGFSDIVELLISKGADVNAGDINGRTPLHDAASSGFLDIVKLLIAEGANVTARDKWGYLPINLANMQGYRHVSEFLRK